MNSHFKYNVPVQSYDGKQKASEPEMWRFAHVPKNRVKNISERKGWKHVLVQNAEEKPEANTSPHRYMRPLPYDCYNLQIY